MEVVSRRVNDSVTSVDAVSSSLLVHVNGSVIVRCRDMVSEMRALRVRVSAPVGVFDGIVETERVPQLGDALVECDDVVDCEIDVDAERLLVKEYEAEEEGVEVGGGVIVALCDIVASVADPVAVAAVRESEGDSDALLVGL